MSEAVGKRIIEALNTMKMTQKELASRIGVTEAVISRYISGDRAPKPEMLANIATALNTTSDFLLGIERDEFDYARVKRILARNASEMTEQQKKELIDALFGEG